ncbi:carbohydrate kinase [Nonomuraea sp. KC401]|uniref:FGGY-family carbohydrate kinase n=1 Tax=unclassified Nonomuraea TaxID=2593643 RepID=UPI0010FDBB6D|nr:MULTISPECIES: FGGY family carbohydrate kinase [unclassified Nonomuraea]NBE94982.1 carbohydrate kinase [Nonomuraea sp. K271]TLF65027.1 carbohydrate kinase [Nonomuraea sp. KC401]
MSVWIGVDLGTQSVRAMAVTGGGDVLGVAARPLDSHRDGPRHEQDPEQWWQALAGATREALRDVPPERVAGVAVDATSGTILLTDARGGALTPALMYDDRRAADEVGRVNEVGGHVWERLGYRRMQPNWALPKLLWLLRDAPPGARPAHQSDFVNRRLTGHDVATDLSNALKTGVDLIEERWPAEVLDALGVPAGLLPEVVRPGTRLGVVCPQAAEQTGIPAGTPVVAGTTDGCAAQLGAGAQRAGSWNSVLGTTLVLKGVTRELIHDPLGVVYSHRAPDGSWLPGGASSTGAGVLTRDLPGRDLDALSAQAAAGFGTRSPGAVTYPLVSRGERFPFAAPDAESFTLGDPADDVERYAAILLGAAFVERLSFDYLDLLGAPVDGEIILTGGATRSAYWTRLRADVLGRPVTLRENAEPAFGMAVLAACSAGGELAGMISTRAVVEPSGADLREPYLRFVGELERRGWLGAAAARHARERTAR